MAKKILLFTTIGKLNKENEAYVRGSFSSWKEYGFDVLVFGEDFHKDFVNEYNFKLTTDYKRSEFNLPHVKSLFINAQKLDYDLYCFLNSDIIFTSDPTDLLNTIKHEEFMAVGQRLDVWGWPNITKEQIHNPGGIDYFFFTKDFIDWNTMPEFSIARGRFDHWIVGSALKSGKAVIDMTPEFLPLHPEPKNRTSGNPSVLFQEGRIDIAYQIIRNTAYYGKERKHGQTDMTPFIISKEGVKIRNTKIPKNEFGE